MSVCVAIQYILFKITDRKKVSKALPDGRIIFFFLISILEISLFYNKILHKKGASPAVLKTVCIHLTSITDDDDHYFVNKKTKIFKLQNNIFHLMAMLHGITHLFLDLFL